MAWCWLGIGVLLAFLLVYSGGEVDMLCSALLSVFALLYKACGRVISSGPRVSGFLLHFHVRWAFWLTSESPPSATQMLNLSCFDQGISHLDSIFHSIAHLLARNQSHKSSDFIIIVQREISILIVVGSFIVYF